MTRIGTPVIVAVLATMLAAGTASGAIGVGRSAVDDGQSAAGRIDETTVAGTVDRDDDGYHSAFAVRIRADTRVEGSVSSAGEPFFVIEADGETIATTGVVERTRTFRRTIQFDGDDLADVDRGSVSITVRLLDEDLFLDDTVDETSLTLAYEPASADRPKATTTAPDGTAPPRTETIRTAAPTSTPPPSTSTPTPTATATREPTPTGTPTIRPTPPPTATPTVTPTATATTSTPAETASSTSTLSTTGIRTPSEPRTANGADDTGATTVEPSGEIVPKTSAAPGASGGAGSGMGVIAALAALLVGGALVARRR